MWYKVARNDYAKYQLFSNFDEIVTQVFHVVEHMKEKLKLAEEQYKNDALSGKSSNPYYEYPIVEQAQSDIGVKYFKSDELGLTVPLRCTNRGGFGGIAEYDNNGGVHLNLQSVALRRRVNNQRDMARILAHELQHAAEHYYQNFSDTLSDKEKHKSKKWSESAEQNMQQQGLEVLNTTAYYNEPTEVRARLAEILLHYGLPQSQSAMQEQMMNSNYADYRNMITQALSEDVMSQLSPEATQYMVKELYKAIWE